MQAENHGKSKVITRDTANTEKRLKLVANFTKNALLLKFFVWFFHIGRVGRNPLSRICYIVARDIKIEVQGSKL